MEAAFLSLIEANQHRIVRICRYYCREEEVRKDLYQEIVYQAWRSFQGYRGEAKASTWLYRVAINTALVHQRRSQKRRMARMEQVPEPSISPDLAANLDQQARLDALRAAIDALPSLDQSLMLLYLEGCAYREMAKILGLSESNVGVKLNRIKRKLGQQLNPSSTSESS
ncbi:MAG: RNA polymerase sigma factor [Bacteroidota bacterium]